MALAVAALVVATPVQVSGQATDVLESIRTEGLERSQLAALAQPLLDSIGPRLTGSPGHARANDWAVRTYRAWGVPVRMEQYGTWRSWDRGALHLDLTSPRTRSLAGTLLTWSIGTDGPVEGEVVLFPEIVDRDAFEAWLPQARGRFIALSPPEPSCRPDESWNTFALPDVADRMRRERAAARQAWLNRVRAPVLSGRALLQRLSDAGALGAISASLWPRGWGVTKPGSAATDRLMEIGLGCEDYGLVFRLAERNQRPVLRVLATARFLGEAPVHNVIAEMRGRQRPNEYVMLSAHFDSWDAASGATDNGTGTLAVMEAMRILRAVYPNPRRTVIAGHWSGEEQGLNGSSAFAVDHPQVVGGLQALFNHDNGTGRVSSISTSGFTGAGDFFRRWLARMPDSLTAGIAISNPPRPEMGSDHFAFACRGAPAFNVSSVDWDYLTYTWHTDRDTYDKVVFDELKRTATVLAMLAYLASEEPERMPRERVTRVNPVTGQPIAWPSCLTPQRVTP
jgi:carboxypeptidase Q